MEIKYVEVPIRVKPHQDYLDMKGVQELWVKIKEYVKEHGGEGVTGAVNEEEVNRIIADYYKEHANELKGDPFTFADFTEEQLNDLRIKGDTGEKGEKGDPFTYEDFTEDQLLALKGEKGDKGNDGTVTFESLTDEQKLTLKGEKGDKGDAFTYADFTEEQLASLKGEKGDKGADGTMVFEDLTEEQRASLKGDKGDKGDQGEVGRAFTYEDFTAEQLEALKVKGDKGDRGEKGEQGIQGIQGVQGVPGVAGEVDYSLVYKKTEVYSKTEIDDKLKDVDFDVDFSDINLENYYDKTEIDTKFNALEIEGSTGVHVGDAEPENPLVSIWVDTDGIPYNGDVDLHETFYTKDEVDSLIENKKHNLSEMVNDIGFLTEATVPTRTSQLENDSGYVTTQEVYTKGSVYNKEEVNALIAGYEPEQPLELHEHSNLQFLEKLGETDGELTYDGVKVATGDVSVDLSGYATETMLSNGLSEKANVFHEHSEYALVDHTHPEVEGSSIYDVVVANGGAIKNHANEMVDTPVANALGKIDSLAGLTLTRTDATCLDVWRQHINTLAKDYYIYASTGVEKLTAGSNDHYWLIIGNHQKLYLMEVWNLLFSTDHVFAANTEVILTEITEANASVTIPENVELKLANGWINFDDSSSSSDLHMWGFYDGFLTQEKSTAVLNALLTVPVLTEVAKNYTIEEWGAKVDELVTNGVSVEGGSVDLSNYYTKTEVDAKIPDISGKADKNHTHSQYLTEHQSLAGYATESFVTSKIAEAQLEGGNGESIDLSGYALKSEIPDVSGFIKTIPSEYVTETELNAKGYLTQHQDLSAYAKKTDIPTVPTKTSQLTNDSGFLTQHQSLANYYTKTEVDNAIANIDDGEKKLVDIDIKYCSDTQCEWIPGDEFDWQDSYQHIGSNDYVWVKEILYYSDGTTFVDYHCTIKPEKVYSKNSAESYMDTYISGKGYQTQTQVQTMIDEAIAAIPVYNGEVL